MTAGLIVTDLSELISIAMKLIGEPVKIDAAQDAGKNESTAKLDDRVLVMINLSKSVPMPVPETGAVAAAETRNADNTGR